MKIDTNRTSPEILDLNWKVRLQQLSACLTDAPGQVWASVSTNFEIQTTPIDRQSFAKAPIPHFGALIYSTAITLHPGNNLMFVHC